jgi:hypothetical protein
MKNRWLDIPKRFNFIMVGLLCGMIYWVVEAAREASIFGKGSIVHCIFEPSAESLWMRLSVGGMLVFFGAIVQCLREQH